MQPELEEIQLDRKPKAEAQPDVKKHEPEAQSESVVKKHIFVKEIPGSHCPHFLVVGT